MSGDEFARVLAEAGEPVPGPRPSGWAGEAVLARMREDLAAVLAARAARWAATAGNRAAARALYERTSRAAGHTPRPGSVPWLSDTPPPFLIM